MISVIIISSLITICAAIYIATPIARGGARLAALAVAGLLAVGVFAAYWVNGEPDTPGQPYDVLVERLRSVDPVTLSPIEQEERLRDALRQDPDDVAARLLLGRFLARTQRELEAVSMFERALRSGEDARILTDLGQALMALNDGSVTDDARRAFERANTLDPNLPEPAFLLGAAAFEDGDRITAARYWSDIIGRLPQDDDFRERIAARAADLLSRPAGGPGSGGAAPFADAAQIDVDAMVASMAARLEARLADQPEDLSGWLTLARTRLMMDDADAARAALQEARTRFAGEPGKIALVSALETAFELQESDA